jgi:hypothetical protein
LAGRADRRHNTFTRQKVYVNQLLVQRAQAGDGDAVGELYERHAPAIFGHCFAWVRDRNLRFMEGQSLKATGRRMCKQPGDRRTAASRAPTLAGN